MGKAFPSRLLPCGATPSPERLRLSNSPVSRPVAAGDSQVTDRFGFPPPLNHDPVRSDRFAPVGTLASLPPDRHFGPPLDREHRPPCCALRRTVLSFRSPDEPVCRSAPHGTPEETGPLMLRLARSSSRVPATGVFLGFVPASQGKREHAEKFGAPSLLRIHGRGAGRPAP